MSLIYIPEYQNKMKFAEEAVMTVQSGDCLYYAFGASSYSDLDIAVAKRQGELQGVNICSASSGRFSKYLRDFEASKKPSQVEAQQVSRVGNKTGLPNIIFMAAVSPMDEDGYFGLLGNSLFDLEVLQIAQIVMLEVNENIHRLPSAHQDCIHISQVDYIVPSSNAPLWSLDKVAKRQVSPNNKQKEYGRSALKKTVI